MTIDGKNWKDFLGQTTNPEKIDTTPQDLKARERFFGKSLASLLGQGPIKPISKKNDKTEIEESSTPEIETEIKKTFWENYDKIIF